MESTRDCKYFFSGSCKKEDACSFRHGLFDSVEKRLGEIKKRKEEKEIKMEVESRYRKDIKRGLISRREIDEKIEKQKKCQHKRIEYSCYHFTSDGDTVKECKDCGKIMGSGNPFAEGLYSCPKGSYA